jgi:hypothetical protein
MQTLNGGICGFAMGLVRTIYLDMDEHLCTLPIDLCSNALLVTAWDMGNRRASNPDEHFRVYNAFSNAESTPCIFHSFVGPSIALGQKYPSIWQVLPASNTNEHGLVSYLAYELKKFCGLLCAMVVGLMAMKGGYVRTYKKLVDRIEDISLRLPKHGIKADTDRMDALYGLDGPLSKDDRETFYFEPASIDYYQLHENMFLKFRREVLKEPDSNIPAARKRMARIEAFIAFCRYGLQVVCFAGVAYLLLF